MNNDWKPIGINEGQGSNTVYSNSTLNSMRIQQPKVICRCDLFGQGQMRSEEHTSDPVTQ